jgi:hypothetical protein
MNRLKARQEELRAFSPASAVMDAPLQGRAWSTTATARRVPFLALPKISRIKSPMVEIP